MLERDVGTSEVIPSQKFSDFKMLVVRRKLSTITSNYDFDNDYETNVATAESYIDYTGDMGVGLFTRNAPPTWEDFQQYATSCLVIGDVVSTTHEGDFNYTMGNLSQNAGQTNYLLDVRQNAGANLPQFGYSGITPISDGHMYAYDCWLTPFKPYTFGVGVFNGKIFFKWYGNSNLITPSWVDGGSLPGDEPIISGVDTNETLNSTSVSYYNTYFFQYQTTWQAPTPGNFKVVPCVMDDKIALNINWLQTTNDTNDPLGHPLACQNTYRDETTISGGTLQDDILWEGILKKYYGTDEGVEGESEEPHFEEDTMVCVYRECSISDLLSYYGYSSSILTSNRSLSSNVFDNLTYGILSQSFMSRPVFLKDINMEEYQETYTDFVENRQVELNDNAWEQVPMSVPKQQESVPHPLYAPAPQDRFGSAGRVYENNDYHYVNFNYKIGPFQYQSNAYDIALDVANVHYMSSGDYANTDANKYFNKSFSETWGNEWTEEMIPLEFADDDKVRFYSFYVDKEKLKQPITIFTYYNKHLPQNKTDYTSDDKMYDSACCVPYMSGCFAHNYTNGTYRGECLGINSNSLKCDNASLYFTVGCHYSNTIFSQNYTSDDESVKKNIVVAGDINEEDDDSIKEFKLFVCKCEVAGYTYGESTQHFKNGICVYTPYCDWILRDNENYAVGEFDIGMSVSLLVPYESATIDDPMQKGDNGNVPRSNPNENLGDGPDDNNPNTKGTNRRHAEEYKPQPPKETNVLSTKLINMYTINQNNMSKLAGDLFSQNIFEQIEHGLTKPIDCVLRLAESRISPIVETNDSTIKLGVANTTAVGNRATKDYRDMDCGGVVIERINGDYTDGEERIELYLPYIGFKTLDSSVLQQSTLYLTYRFNFLNGKCLAILTMSPRKGHALYGIAKNVYLTQFTGEFMTTLPIGTSSNTGMLSMLTATGLGLATRQPVYARSALRSLPTAFTPSFEHCGDFGSNMANMYDLFTPYVRKYSVQHTRPHATPSSNYGETISGKVNGESSYKTMIISKCKKGFMQCDNFEMKATPTNITAEEYFKIQSLMNEGVWKETPAIK